jgi:hypothetical protein
MGDESQRYKNTFSVVKNAVGPLLALMDALIAQISDVDRQDPEARRIKVYPETLALEQIHGVLTLTAPTFVLTVEIVDVLMVRETVFEDVPFCCTWAIPDWEPVETVATICVLLQLTTVPRLVPSHTVPVPCTDPKPDPEIVI